MFTSLGVIQRDAPTQGHTPEFQASQAQMASEFVTAIKEMKRIVNEELPGLYASASLDGGLDSEEAKQVLRGKIGKVSEDIQQKERQCAGLQVLFDDIFKETMLHA